MNQKTIIFLLAITLALGGPAKAQGFGTNYYQLLCCTNRTYTNATIEKVNPVTVKIFWETSDEKIPITNLPAEVQTRYYNPQEAKEYLDAQAAKMAAIAKAKSTLGAAQKIRIIRVLPDGYLQIEAERKVGEAYIDNLPPEILAFLRKINKTQADIARLTAANFAAGQAAATTPHTAQATAAHATAQAALHKTESHLRELQAQFRESRSVVIARPTAFIIGAVTRQWEFQAMDTPGQRGLDTRP